MAEMATESGPSGGDRYVVRSLDRAIRLLDCFTEDEPFLPLKDVAARTGLDKATARRLLMTLRTNGLIEQDPRTQHYSLGLGLLRLARSVRRPESLEELSAPSLKELARETRTTCFLSVEQQERALCIGRYFSNSPFKVMWWSVGTERKLNCGSAPRLLLAHAKPSVQERVLAGELDKYTEQSLVDPAELRRRLAVIRSRGWEIAVDDVHPGLAAAAVPVKVKDGTVIASISMAGLTQNVVKDEAPLYLAALHQAATRIEGALSALDVSPDEIHSYY